jgi:hypothetical protein
MSAVTLYTVRFRRRHLRKWAGRIPREIGATLISEAICELLSTGNGAAVKSLEFVAHADARKRRRASTAPETA